MDDLQQDKIIELLKKLEDSQITQEEKLTILKMINASVKEFNGMLKELNLAVKNNN